MRVEKHILTTVLLALLFAGGSFAQGLRYENVRDRNFWLLGGNVAGMRVDSLNLSFAELSGGYTFGENRQSWEAPSTWHAGAQAATIKHLKNFSMAGTFAFDQNMGYNATGSMFVNPFRYPVDVIEYVPGTKNKQTYSFSGDISVDVHEQWRVGGAVEFKAVNYSKRKDLRYTNYALDLNLRPGFQWHKDGLAIGLNAVIERNTETIKVEQIGSLIEEDYAFLNKGQWYGVYQYWEGSGVHLNESGINEFPVMEIGYGGAFQLSAGPFYFEGGYVRREGKIGEKDAIWFRYPADEFTATLGWNAVSEKGTVHTARLDGKYKYLVLGESVIEQVTIGGVTTRTGHGWNTIDSGSALEISPSWNAVREGRFEFVLKGTYSLDQNLASIQYPYLNGQTLQRAYAYGEARGIFNGWMPVVCLWGGRGWISEKIRYSGNKGVAMPQFREEAYYELWRKYETSAYIGAGVGLRYIFRKGFYLQADVRDEFRMRQTRLTTGLSFGYTF